MGGVEVVMVIDNFVKTRLTELCVLAQGLQDSMRLMRAWSFGDNRDGLKS